MTPGRPLAIDLYCGAGGWTRGLLAAGFRVVGFDLVRFAQYPGELVLQDVTTIDGRRLRGAALIVASPPCTEFSQCWSFQKAREPDPESAIVFVDHAYRIAREAGAPLVLENVRGAEPYIGRARAHCGSFYLWGDVPALLPTTRYTKGIWNCKRGFVPGFVRRPELRGQVPFELAHHIGKCFLPAAAEEVSA